MSANWKSISLIVIVAIVGFFGGYYYRTVPEAHQQIEDSGDLYLPMIGLNDSLWEQEILFYAKIPRDLSLKEKCDHLSSYVSKRLFKGLPVEIISIEQRDNKRLAIVNLSEAEESRISWKSNYFQGSSGSMHSSIELTCTYLQMDYDGEWIDGVQFYYEGKPIDGNWGHIDLLKDIIWRDSCGCVRFEETGSL